MFKSQNFRQVSDDLFLLRISKKKDFKILQLTDLHLGLGAFSRRKDKLALRAVYSLVKRTNPDLIILTGDSVFPFFPKAGSLKQRGSG